jgi:hypothetical protein
MRKIIGLAAVGIGLAVALFGVAPARAASLTWHPPTDDSCGYCSAPAAKCFIVICEGETKNGISAKQVIGSDSLNQPVGY